MPTIIFARLHAYLSQRIYLLGGILCLFASLTLVANATLTVSNTGLSGDADVSVDGAGTLNLGTASSTAITIGQASVPVTVPGTLAVQEALTLGFASTTAGQLILQNAENGFTTLLQASSSQSANLTFTLPPTVGTAGQALLTDGTGTLYFGDSGASQWVSNPDGSISYDGGNVAVGATVPADAPTGSIAVGGRIYAPPQQASKYFVDATDGSDANAGTSPSSAWQTVEKADANTLTAGQSIAIKSYTAPVQLLGHDNSFAYVDTWATMRTGPWTNYEITAGTLFDAGEADWTKALGGETAVVEPDNAEHYRSGTGSLKITSDGTTTRADKTISASFAAAETISFWVYVSAIDQSNISYLYLYLCSTANCSANMAYGVTGANLHRGWNYITLATSEFTAAGGETWASTMIKARFTLVVTGGTPAVYVDDIYTGTMRRPKVILTFDDGYESQYTEALAYMQPRGIKGVVYVIRELVGTAGYATVSQLQTIYDAGWDLGIHGETVLTTLENVASQKAEIGAQRQYLLDNGWARAANHYAYPGGQFNDDSLLALAQLGILTARSTTNRTQGNLIDERYIMARFGVGNYDLSVVTGQVDKAVARGTSLWINIHRIVESPGSATEWSIASFRGLIDYLVTLRDAGALDVVTVSDWYRGLYQ